MPKRCGHLSGKSLVAAEEMAAKIRAAVAARRDTDFVIVARTDARGYRLRRRCSPCEALCGRGGRRDLPRAMESAAEFAAFAKAVPCPLLANMTEFGKSRSST